AGDGVATRDARSAVLRTRACVAAPTRADPVAVAASSAVATDEGATDAVGHIASRARRGVRRGDSAGVGKAAGVAGDAGVAGVTGVTRTTGLDSAADRGVALEAGVDGTCS